MTSHAPRSLPTRLMLQLSAVACVAAFALTPALAKPKSDPPGQQQPAKVSCEDSTRIAGNAGYTGLCQGVLSGTIAKNQNPTAAFEFGGEEWSFDYFDSLGGAEATEGTLGLGQKLYGLFVLGIKGGPTYSLYLFDGGDEGINGIEYDTLGIAKGNGDAGPALSHAVLFTPGGVLPPMPTGAPTGGPTGDEVPGDTPSQGPTVPSAAQQVPEPASGALAVLALAAAGLAARRRRNR